MSFFKMFFHILLTTFLCVLQVETLENKINIGAIFDKSDGQIFRKMFKFAVSESKKSVFAKNPNQIEQNLKLLQSSNSLEVLKKVCSLIDTKPIAIFGPEDSESISHVRSTCYALEIPNVIFRINYEDQNNVVSVNIFPDYDLLGQAYNDLINYWKWTDIVILYQDYKEIAKLESIVRNLPVTKNVINVNEDNARSTMRLVKANAWCNVILSASLQLTEKLLKIGLQLEMMNENYHYILATLDAMQLDLQDYGYNYVNISTFSLINKASPQYPSYQEIIRAVELNPDEHAMLHSSMNDIYTESAVLFDAVLFIAGAARSFIKSSYILPINVSCTSGVPSGYGSSFLNFINTNEYNGITGPIKIKNNKRSYFNLNLLQLHEEKLVKIGEWNPSSKLKVTKKKMFPKYTEITQVQNKTLIITSILEKPYVSLTKCAIENNCQKEEDMYQGFCIDLLKKLSERVGFKYKIKIVPDGQYGAIGDNGEWTGMVKELMEGRADLSVAPITISNVRNQVIDFTTPFMSLGISILMKVPKKSKPGLFSFLDPLSIDIWLYVVAAFFCVTFLMFLISRFTPYEWIQYQTCEHNEIMVENKFSITNTFWFILGALMQQGSDVNPSAISTRILGGSWWFFTLIIISSYTANLAAFLTVERMENPIESVDDLADQSIISYGTLKGGSTETFFKTSKMLTFQKMWQYMKNTERSVFTSTQEEGVERVLKEKYAFFMESTTLEFKVSKNCDLMQVGGLLDAKGYGIGTQKGSPLRDIISLAVLELEEKSEIIEMKNKWWNERASQCHQENSARESKANELTLENVGGIFVILACGVTCSILIAIIEFIWKTKKTACHDKQSILAEMIEEMKYALRIHVSTKKPALKRSCQQCFSQEQLTEWTNEDLAVPIARSANLSKRYSTHKPIFY